MGPRRLGDGRTDIEPRGDYPPEWDELTAELPEEWEPDPDEPDDRYLPEDYPC